MPRKQEDTRLGKANQELGNGQLQITNYELRITKDPCQIVMARAVATAVNFPPRAFGWQTARGAKRSAAATIYHVRPW